MKFDQIKEPILSNLEEFEIYFKNSMRSKVPLLDIVTNYILKKKGKQMRPMFVFLSASLQSKPTNSTLIGAALIELLHTATLVHDDIVDDSNKRRGFFSINALWKNKIAVLVGDFLLSKGMLLALENKEYQLLEIVSRATREMSEGELLQIEKARKLDINEEIYFEIIRKKTASLIASCCAAGMASSGGNEEQIEKMYKIGESIGIAFQIKDDLFDYSTENQIGKPTGIDIKEKKMTLPLIFTLAKLPLLQKRQMILKIKYQNNNKNEVKKIIKQVNESGGIEYAQQKMNEYIAKALEMLDGFEDSAAKKSLIGLINYTVERKK
jgi:octaprenyl-diphosphate synthase